MSTYRPLLIALGLLLTGCERLGIEDPAKLAAAKEAEGKAVGAACRHAGRAIEDCYALNSKVPKSAVFAGWKDMNDYMRENKIDTVEPLIAGAKSKLKKADAQGDDETPEAAQVKPASEAGKPAEAEAKTETKTPRKAAGHG